MSKKCADGTPLGLVDKMAEKFTISPGTLLQTLKATAFRQSNTVITDEQMFALLIVADQYHLNPFTREIYAFPDRNGGIVPVVGVDGWNRIANEHPHFDGVEFVYSDDIVQPEGSLAHCHAWIEAVLYRKDRTHPTRVREYLDECYRTPIKDRKSGYSRPGPWQTHPKRCLRHKAEIQCYRIGFGFVGIYDEDEASRIIDAQTEGPPASNAASVASAAQPSQVALPIPDLDAFLQDAERVQEVDEFLAKLVKRAQASKQWQAAAELVRERLSGDARVYALDQLSRARARGCTEVTQAAHAAQAVAATEAPVPEVADAGNFI